MNIDYIEDLFSAEELEILNNCIKESELVSDDNELGRLKITLNTVPPEIEKKLEKIASNILKKEMKTSHILYVEYSNKFGQPNLPPHFDADKNSLVFDYQLEANTNWDLGVGTKNYPLKDNSALLFNANENIHWRPIKEFKDGEYVRMICIRFRDSESPSDYSNLNYWQNDEIFKDARTYRSMLNRFEKTKLGKSEGEK
jgi:hypothetical protein